MSGRRPLTHCGCDVALLAALPCGRVHIAYLDPQGLRNGQGARVWPHELRGVGWHLADIKRAIAALAARPSEAATPTAPPVASPAPRGFLYAHHVAYHQRED